MSTRASRFLRNFSFSFGGQICLAALSFFFVPMLVHGLGLEIYGLYVLLYACTNYLSLTVLGAGTASIKFAAEAIGGRDGTRLRDALKWSALLHSLGPAAAAFTLAACAPWVSAHVFHVGPEHAAQAAIVLRCAAAASVFWAVAQWASSALQGAQRFDAYNAVILVQSGLGTAGAALLVRAGHGLRAAALWYVAVNAFSAALALGLFARLVGPQVRSLTGGQHLPARRFVNYSVLLWLAPLASIITFQFDKVFIARATSLAALSLYAVPANLLQRLQILPSSVGSVVVPMMSELGAEHHEDLARIYAKTQRFSLWIVLPILAVLFAVMPQFLGLWLGGDFGGISVWPARLLVIAQAVYSMTTISHAASVSRDRPSWMSGLAWAQAILSLLFWRLLIPRWQLLGVAAGSLLAQALPAIVYLAMIHRLIRLPNWRFIAGVVARPAVAGSLLLLFLLLLHGKAGSWLSLAALCSAGGVVYAAAALILAGPDDREALRWALAKLKRRAGVSRAV